MNDGSTGANSRASQAWQGHISEWPLHKCHRKMLQQGLCGHIPLQMSLNHMLQCSHIQVSTLTPSSAERLPSRSPSRPPSSPSSSPVTPSSCSSAAGAAGCALAVAWLEA